MEFTRWYDKNENLKLLIQALEQLDDETKLFVAVDIIQMIIESKFPKTDKLIENLNAEYLPIRRRWYDSSETLHSAVEMLKLMETEEKDKFIQELYNSMFYFTQCNSQSQSDEENK